MPSQESITEIFGLIDNRFAIDPGVEVILSEDGLTERELEGPRRESDTDKVFVYVYFEPTFSEGRALGRAGTRKRRETGIVQIHTIESKYTKQSRVVEVDDAIECEMLRAIEGQLLNHGVCLDQDLMESEKGIRRSGKVRGVTRLASYIRQYTKQIDGS
ncbi:MAG: hypothetical protein AAGB02_03145 [Pseudomonadota bacterium]